MKRFDEHLPSDAIIDLLVTLAKISYHGLLPMGIMRVESAVFYAGIALRDLSSNIGVNKYEKMLSVGRRLTLSS